MAGGYKLPGTEITEIGQSVTARPSSTQRKPCFIGKASPYKKVTYEALVRGTNDTLAYGSYGIYSVLSAGTQKGLSNLIEGKDFTINTANGQITWITDTETKNIAGDVYGLDLFASLDNFSAFDAAVIGVNATSGYQEVGLNVLGTAASGITSTGVYSFRVNTINYNITVNAGATINEIIALMDAQVTSAGFTVALINADIRITNDLTGSTANVTLAAGTGTNLFSHLTGFTTFDVAIPGADATSGYQEVGLNTLAGNASGLDASTRYYFKVNGTQYSITTSSGLLFSDIVTLLDTAVTADGITVSFTGGDIRFTKDTTGVSSIITLTQVASKIASNGQMEFTLSAGITYAHKAGKASVSAVVGANTYVFGIADDISITDTTINLSGTESQLNAITVGTVLTISTILPVAVGGTYFVTYKYNRETADYVYKEFSKFDDVLNDLGDDTPDNPLVMIANLAFTYYGVPVIGVVQVPPSNQNSDYVDALELVRNRDVQTLGILNTSATVRNATIAHVNDRNLTENKRERMYYAGASALYPLGDNTVADSVCGISYSIKNDSIVFPNITRAKYYYKDPVTQLDTQTTVDGAFVAAAIAAYRDSFPYSAQTILGHVIPGLELFSEDFDDYFNDDALKTAGNASCFLARIGSSNSLVVVDDLTTDNRSIERNNINIITAKHYIQKDVRLQLDRTFVGNLITDRNIYKTDVETYLIRLLNTYKNMKIIENVVSVVVTLPPDRRDTIIVFFAYNAIYTGKYFEVTYTIAV
jgi:hypothetical protein